MPEILDPLTDTASLEDVDVNALAETFLPEWIARNTDRESWLATFIEAFVETRDALMSALAATGRVTKRRILGLKSENGASIVQGWGLLFTNKTDLDLQETYFAEDTQLLLDMYERGPLFYEHGEDPDYGVKPIGRRNRAVLYPRGVWAEHTLDPTHPLYERTLSELENGELAYSSDSLGHLVEKGYDERDGRLAFWPIAGWSLTKNPAEPALGAVTLKQFAKALKSVQREADTQDSAAPETPLDSDHPLSPKGISPMNASEIFVKLAEVFGLPADVTAADLEAAMLDAIAAMQASPEAAASTHAAMGGDENTPPDPEDLAEKMRNLYKMATEDTSDAAPEPIPATMSYAALRSVAELATGRAGKSAMPYQVNTQKSPVRDFSTRGAPYLHKGIPEAGVSGIFKDLHNASRGMPTTYIGKKAMSYATGPAGGYVLTQEVSDNILDPLRAEAVCFKLGAKQEDFDGIQTKQIPAMQSAPEAYWVGEGQTVTDSQPAYRMITAVPKPLASLVQRPFNFFQNMTPNAETQLRKEIQKSLALKIDFAAMLGIGGAAASPNTGTSPVGLLNIPGVTNTSLATNGRQPTIADLIGAQKRIDAANVPAGGSRGWAFHSNVRHVFTGMSDSTGNPILRESWGSSEEKSILGEPFATSNQIPTNVTTGSNTNTSYIFYGDWQYMTIAMTTTVELVLDQTYAAQLLQGVLAYVYCDVVVTYKEAFQTISGVTYT